MGGGSKQPATTTTIQKTELPAWLEDVTKENLRIADDISKRPYEAYSGERIAGFTPEQEEAFDYMKKGVGMTTPLFDRAAGVTSDVAAYSPERVKAGSMDFERITAPSFLEGDINAYLNPYLSNVESAAISRLQDTSQQNINRLGDQARAAGAFGGSRQGIAEGVALGEAARSAGELSGKLRAAGFDTASALLQADQANALRAALANQQAGVTTGQANLDALMRAQLANQSAGLQGANLRLNAAGQLGNVAQQSQASRLQDAGLLEQIGMQRQGLQQSLLDEAYGQFLEERNYPIDMLNLRLGATSATPYGGTSTTTSTAPRQSGSGLLTGLGAAGTVASIGASLATIF
jgi:hypothetical protein